MNVVCPVAAEPKLTFSRDQYRAQWHPEVRLISLAFEPQAYMRGPVTRALFQFIAPHVADGRPWIMLVDATNVANVDADTRRMAREFFVQHQACMRFGAYGGNLLVRTMFGIFVMTAHLTGQMFLTRDEALGWLGINGDYPPA